MLVGSAIGQLQADISLDYVCYEGRVSNPDNSICQLEAAWNHILYAVRCFAWNIGNTTVGSTAAIANNINNSSGFAEPQIQGPFGHTGATGWTGQYIEVGAFDFSTNSSWLAVFIPAP